jgi:hypothetical protein
MGGACRIYAGITRIDVTSPRVFAAMRDGRVSFGAIDKLMQGGGQPFAGLPDIDLRIAGGVMAISTPAGVWRHPVGTGQSGRGFDGPLAVSAPHLRAGGCDGGVRLIGRLGDGRGAHH